jgi:hypothetical protein
MPRSGGIFSLISSYFATPGQTIRTEQHNPVLEDIATALTGSVARDGSSPMLGNLPMNGRKITNLGAATLASDVPRFDQVLPSSPYLNAVSGLTLAADRIPYATGPTTAAITPLTAFGRSLIDDADAAAGRATLGAQAAGATLTSLEGLSLVAGDILYATGPDTLARLPKGTAGQVIAQNAGLTAPEWVNGFSKSYESAQTTVALNTLYTFAHGLGGVPKLMQAYYVCKSATNGYEIGDYVPILQGTENYNSNVSPAMILSATQIKVRIASNALMESIGIDGTTRSNYLPANFDLLVRAWA